MEWYTQFKSQYPLFLKLHATVFAYSKVNMLDKHHEIHISMTIKIFMNNVFTNVKCKINKPATAKDEWHQEDLNRPTQSDTKAVREPPSRRFNIWQEVKIKAPRNARPQHPAKPVRGIRPTSPAQRCPFLSSISFGQCKRNGQSDLKGAKHLLVIAWPMQNQNFFDIFQKYPFSLRIYNWHASEIQIFWGEQWVLPWNLQKNSLNK